METQPRVDALAETDTAVPASVAVERRRSQRLAMCVPILVYGCAKDEEPFCEETKTVCVNSTGGLFTLAMRVRLGQELLLIHGKTEKEHPCQVVYLGPRELNEKTRVAVAFSDVAPDFWDAQP